MRSHATPKKHQKSTSIISTGTAMHLLVFYGEVKVSRAQQVEPRLGDALRQLNITGVHGGETCAQALLNHLDVEFPFHVGDLFCTGNLELYFLNVSHQDVLMCVQCHSHGEFGFVTEQERVSNLVAIKTAQGRVTSRFLLDNGMPVSVFTEWVDGQPETTATMNGSTGTLRAWH